MITQEKIDELVSWDGLKEFGSFILSHCENDALPDYGNINILQVPHLVPSIWVYDLRDDEKKEKLRLNFCGQKHVDMHGFNPMGMNDTDLFVGDPLIDRINAFYEKSISEKKTGFTTRYKDYTLSTGEKHWRYLEFLFFPCSTDGHTVNWGIGCINFDIRPQNGENIFLHF